MLLSVTELAVNYRSGSYTIRALDNVSLDVDRNEIVAVVGESGSGKSTLALSIPNLLPSSASVERGRIIFNGIDMLKLPEEILRKIRGKEIGMIFQDPMSYLNPVMKVGEQVAEIIMIHEGVDREAAKSRAIEILEEVKVPDPKRVYDYYPYQLSGGMAQRVMIGAAIALGPSLIIADEPTSNLDVTVQAQILNLLKNLKKKHGTSIIIISHDMGIVGGLADRVIVLYAGKVVEEGRTRQILTQPKHPYTRMLVGASRAREGKITEIQGTLPDLTNLPKGCRFAPRCPLVFDKCSLDPPEVSWPDKSRVLCWLYEN